MKNSLHQTHFVYVSVCHFLPWIVRVLLFFLYHHQYSGGQAFQGQGGFYGAAGHRAAAGDHADDGRGLMLAVASDVEAIENVMDEVDRLESLLRSEDETSVSSKTIELKANIKKLVTAPEFVEALNRLEVQGAPIWGLSTAEREMIVEAKEKMRQA